MKRIKNFRILVEEIQPGDILVVFGVPKLPVIDVEIGLGNVHITLQDGQLWSTFVGAEVTVTREVEL